MPDFVFVSVPPALPVSGKFQQKFLLVATMGYMPDITRDEMFVRSRHTLLFFLNSTILYVKLAFQAFETGQIQYFNLLLQILNRVRPRYIIRDVQTDIEAMMAGK